MEKLIVTFVAPRTEYLRSILTYKTTQRLEQAQAIYEEEWRREIMMQDELFMKLHARLPKELIFQRELLLARL